MEVGRNLRYFRIILQVISFVLFTSFQVEAVEYSIPEVSFELLKPRGFRASIPDEEGITLFSFVGNFGRTVVTPDPDFVFETTHPKDGKWTYENKTQVILPGNLITYTVRVQKGDQTYQISNEKYNVPDIEYTEIYDEAKSCVLSKTTVNGRRVCKGELIFEENFENLNSTVWSKDVRIPLDVNDADFVSFQNRPENCYIKSNQLYILPKLITDFPEFTEEDVHLGELDLGYECTGIVDPDRECKRKAGLFRILPPIVSARITTKDFFSFKYGKIEVRARLPRGDWLFPQIFLEPTTSAYGLNGYASGQMRVAFIRANDVLETKEGKPIDGHELSGGFVLTRGEEYRDVWLKRKHGYHFGKYFHTFTLKWADDHLTLGLNGQLHSSFTGGFKAHSFLVNESRSRRWDAGTYMAPFDKEFHISLGVSAGGVSDFPDGCINGPAGDPKPWNNTDPKAELKFWNDRRNWAKTWRGENAALIIDYIKVWAL